MGGRDGGGLKQSFFFLSLTIRRGRFCPYVTSSNDRSLPQFPHLQSKWLRCPDNQAKNLLSIYYVPSTMNTRFKKPCLCGDEHSIADKGPSSQSYGFSSSHIHMYTCWTMKKAERQRTNAFELWYWRRFLRVPWTARRANQSILKEINPEYSLEGLMLKLKLPYFWPPDVKSRLIGKDPDAGKD